MIHDCFRNEIITKETLLNAQNRSDLSNQTLLNLAASLREDGIKIEPGLKNTLNNSGKIFEDFFELKNVEMEVKQDDELVTKSMPLVVCKDVDEFVEEIKRKRNIQNPVKLKFGADGGGKSMKNSKRKKLRQIEAQLVP